MKPYPSADIVIRIDAVDQLFNAPTVDPFSDKPHVVVGDAALLYAIRQELSRGMRDWKGKRLVVQLPPEQISPDLQTKTIEAVRRYAQVKQNQNQNLIRISRFRSLVGLGIAIAIAAVLLIILVLVLNSLLAHASDIVKGMLVGIMTIFIWSTVWNPWERLVYEWVAPWLENRILRSIMLMDIIIRPEPLSG
jgi:hypothetical protein